MNATVVPIHVTRAAKERGVMAAAGLRGMAAGLSQIQTQALMRYARDRFRSGHTSPARAVADAWARARELARDTTA